MVSTLTGGPSVIAIVSKLWPHYGIHEVYVVHPTLSLAARVDTTPPGQASHSPNTLSQVTQTAIKSAVQPTRVPSWQKQSSTQR